MDVVTWSEIQEGILYVFGPAIFWWLVILVVGTVLSSIGAVVLEVVRNITR